MENGKVPQGGIRPEQLRSMLASKEGKQLMELLSRDGGIALRQASAAAKNGDYDRAKRIMEPLMQSPEAVWLVDEINRK